MCEWRMASDTRELTQITRDGLVEVQRALMSPDLAVVGEVKDGKLNAIDFFVKWKNSGNTSTKNLLVHQNHQISAVPLPEDFKYPDNWEPGVPQIATPSFAGPQGVITSTPPTTVSADAVKDIQAHRMTLTLWGSARYNDVFRGTKPHVSKYCFNVTGFYGDLLPPNPIVPITVNCKTHNCHDDECAAEK